MYYYLFVGFFLLNAATVSAMEKDLSDEEEDLVLSLQKLCINTVADHKKDFDYSKLRGTAAHDEVDEKLMHTMPEITLPSAEVLHAKCEELALRTFAKGSDVIEKLAGKKMLAPAIIVSITLSWDDYEAKKLKEIRERYAKDPNLEKRLMRAETMCLAALKMNTELLWEDLLKDYPGFLQQHKEGAHEVKMYFDENPQGISNFYTERRKEIFHDNEVK